MKKIILTTLLLTALSRPINEGYLSFKQKIDSNIFTRLKLMATNIHNTSLLVKLTDIISKQSVRYKINPLIIIGIIKIESQFNPNAISKTHDRGLMQINSVVHQTKLNLLNPIVNIQFGTLLLSKIKHRDSCWFTRFHSNHKHLRRLYERKLAKALSIPKSELCAM